MTGTTIIAIALGITFGVFMTLGFNAENYYSDGQADALRGKWQYERVLKPGGGEEIIRLDKPTTQPVTVGQ